MVDFDYADAHLQVHHQRRAGMLKGFVKSEGIEMPEGPMQQGVELVQGGTTLDEILTKYAGNNIYWFACQVNNLNATGVDIGAGQGQDMQ